MEQEENKIILLIQKYISNKSTYSETLELISWLKSTDNHDAFTQSSQDLWHMIDAQQASITSEESRLVLQKEIAQLLSNSRSKQQSLREQKPKYNFAPFYRIVAVLAIIFGVTLAVYVSLSKTPQDIVYAVQETKRGELKEILLDDGTKVMLNVTTKISIPSDFNETSRLISLEGEAFFEVAPNAKKPFIIQSGDAKIKVLGTSFNVKAYDIDQLITVTVSTGKVSVGLESEELQLSLTSNEHLIVNKVTGDFEKKEITDNNYIKWQSGALYFEKSPIQEVVKELNRKYKRSVVLQAGVGNFTISGMHDSKSLEAVIESICFTTGLSFKAVGEEILIYE